MEILAQSHQHGDTCTESAQSQVQRAIRAKCKERGARSQVHRAKCIEPSAKSEHRAKCVELGA